MPLRDHFRSPRDDLHACDELLGQWPAMIVLQLFPLLWKGYKAAPRIHLESLCDEYEVRIYDARRGRRLVAAIEIVSPANKDRPEHRSVFVAKCSALLQQQVSVSIVDLVTIRDFNLYEQLLAQMGHQDPSLGNPAPATYAVTCRTRSAGNGNLLDTWTYPLTVGQRLPRIPLWLAEERMISLDLEASYEETCRVLHISNGD